MSSVTKVRVDTTGYPEAHLEWQVALVPPGVDPDPLALFLYNNLCYDLVSAVVAKLGLEYSKWLLEGGDAASFEVAAQKIMDAVQGR